MNDVENCTVFGRCGGCSSLNVPYSEQLKEKDSAVAKLFAGVAPEGSLRPIKGMSNPYHYRDKVMSPLVLGRKAAGGRRAGGSGRAAGAAGGAPGRRAGAASTAREIVTGMYAKGTHEVIPSDGCLLENATAQDVVRAVASIMRRHGVEPYNEDAHAGFMRHVVVRVGHSSGEVLVTLVTNGDEFPHSKSFCRELVRRVPAVTTVVQNVNTRQTNVVMGERERTLYGPGFILDELCGMSFRISSQSFYQVNSEQTEVLYRTAVDLAGLAGGETVVDAYCGTGTIGLVAAGSAPVRLIGFDSEASSIRDARQNARHNGIDDAEFVAADASEFMATVAAESVRDRGPLVLFMDPPRAGSTPEFLDAAAALSPDRIVYISCNPQTQVRDVERLAKSGYAVEVIQPVDMFPHTDHIECIVSLSKAGPVTDGARSGADEGMADGSPGQPPASGAHVVEGGV